MKQSKRIAIVIDSLSGGGAEKVMLTLAKALHRLGHQPHFIVLQNKGEYQIPDFIPSHACFAVRESNLDVFWKRYKSAQKLKHLIVEIEAQFGKFDLFLSNLDKANLLMSYIEVSPLYFVVHNSVEAELKRQKKMGSFAYLKMLRAKKIMSGQDLICVSKGVSNEILEGQLIKPKSVQTIYNPIDLDSVRQLSLETNSNIPEGQFLIHVGRVAKQKRHDILFKALREAKTELPLVLLCNKPKKAKNLAKKYNVEDRVIIPGFQTNPYAWIRKAKALVLSSDYEGLGMVLIEALACGTPVVSTDCPHGPKEIMVGDLSKYLVHVGDFSALAKKIDEIVEDNINVADAGILSKVEALNVANCYLRLIG